MSSVNLTPAAIAALDAAMDSAVERGVVTAKPGLGKKSAQQGYDFGQPEPQRPGYITPTRSEQLNGLSRVQLRDRVRRSGLFNPSICSVLTRKEIKLVLLDVYPFESSAAYDTEPRTLRSRSDVIQLCGDRRVAFRAKQAEEKRTRRRAKIDEIGEMAALLDPNEIIEQRISGKVFTLTTPNAVEVTDRRADRYFDIDGRAGRGSHYVFRDIQSGELLRISAYLWYGDHTREGLVTDPSFRAHFRGFEKMIPPRSGKRTFERHPVATRRGSSELFLADISEAGL